MEIVKKSVSGDGSETYRDSKPPKQQLVKPVTPKKEDPAMGVGVLMSNVENKCAF